MLPFESPWFDPDHPYLRKHLIAYIGNKRSQLDRLHRAFSSLESRRRINVFLDPFAGSGAVARLARTMGYRVLANDWEFYSYVLNFCHLCIRPRELPGLLVEKGGVEETFRILNTLSEVPEGDRYISRFYAPADTTRADYRTERLFYTAENARKIDAVRNRIEGWYPGFDSTGPRCTEKMLLLSSLLYECATHTNTSGVFKAYHKGFGGHSRDALKRITAGIELEIPVLHDSEQDSVVSCVDARQFAASHPADLCYLDPPYNQHQYGSNYHMLNTIALWDRPPVDDARSPDGTLRQKAGIRRDWVRTRSPFCRRETALKALHDLLEDVDAPLIVLSYNTEGVISLDDLMGELEKHGGIELFSNDYVKYRGGKQSIRREVHNMEMLVIVDRGHTTDGKQKHDVERHLREREIRMLLKQSFDPQRIEAVFRHDPEAIYFASENDAEFRLAMMHLYRFKGLPESLCRLSDTELDQLRVKLVECICVDRQEELRVVVSVLRTRLSEAERRWYSRRALWLLRKFAFRKYRDQFWAELIWLKQLTEMEPSLFGRLCEGLAELERLARLRFEG